MNFNKAVLLFVCAVITFVGIFGLCKKKNKQDPPKKEETKNIESIIAPKTPDTLPTDDETFIFDLKDEMKETYSSYGSDNENAIEKRITFPFFVGNFNCDSINRAIEIFAKKYAEISQTEKQECNDSNGRNDGYHLDLTSEYEFCLKGSCLSVLFFFSETRSTGISEMHYYDSLNFDCRTGEIIELTDFLSVKKETVLSYYRNAFEIYVRDNTEKCYDDALEIINSSFYNMNYYVSDDSIFFYVGPGIISPYVYGSSIVSIKLDEFK